MICKSEMLIWGLENPRPFVIHFVSGEWPGSPLPIVGVAFARYILVGCWKNLIDTLSTPLTGRMAGSSKGLAFILGAEGIKEQNQKERDAICMSLDGLRKAARLSCALGTCGDPWPEWRSLQNSLGKSSFRWGSFGTYLETILMLRGRYLFLLKGLLLTALQPLPRWQLLPVSRKRKKKGKPRSPVMP